jgi:hypothetical protein
MIDSLFNTLLFCSHRRISFPMTIRRQPHAFSSAPCGNQTFVICLDCGKEFSYNWKEMRIDAAEPLVGFRMQRIAASWLRSARAALINAAVNYHRFFSDQKASTKLNSAICSSIETVASVWYLQPATFRTVMSVVQLRLCKRRNTKWPAIAKTEARIQVAIVGLKKIVNTAVQDVNQLQTQWRCPAMVGPGTVKSPPPKVAPVGSGSQGVKVQAHPRLLFATESQIEFLSRLPRRD